MLSGEQKPGTLETFPLFRVYCEISILCLRACVFMLVLDLSSVYYLWYPY